MDEPEDSKLQLPPEKPNSVITLRMPKSLHAAIKERAYILKISINQYCIAVLSGMLVDTLQTALQTAENLEE